MPLQNSYKQKFLSWPANAGHPGERSALPEKVPEQIASPAPIPDFRFLPSGYAAALRLIASRASMVVTVSSIVLLRMPFCAAIICTRRSVRSILGAPAKSARAAEDGRTRLAAAAAYF